MRCWLAIRSVYRSIVERVQNYARNLAGPGAPLVSPRGSGWSPSTGVPWPPGEWPLPPAVRREGGREGERSLCKKVHATYTSLR